MKLTKSQRHIVYILALSQLEYRQKHGNLFAFICFAIDDIFGNDVLDIIELPELWEKRPSCVNNPKETWFFSFDFEPRIKILKECIKETY